MKGQPSLFATLWRSSISKSDGTADSSSATAIILPSVVFYVFLLRKLPFSAQLSSVFAGGDKTQAWSDLLCAPRDLTLSTWLVRKWPRAPSVSSCNAQKGYSAEHDQPPNLTQGCNAASQITASSFVVATKMCFVLRSLALEWRMVGILRRIPSGLITARL